VQSSSLVFQEFDNNKTTTEETKETPTEEVEEEKKESKSSSSVPSVVSQEEEKEIEERIQAITKKWSGEDLFVEEEEDPKKTNALASSLWEVKVRSLLLLIIA
jgi:hypothetical protein